MEILNFLTLLVLIATISSGALCDLQIVNGSVAAIEAYPWQISFNRGEWRFWSSWYHYCGGVIIAKNWILTAAHCAVKELGFFEQSIIRAGSNTSTSGGFEFTKKNTIIHPLWKDKLPGYDVALVELNEDIQFNSQMQNIIMVNENFTISEDHQVDATGYGQTCFECPPSERLFLSHMSTISNIECDDIFRTVTDQNICAIDIYEVSTTCKSDSGGPLIIRDGDNGTNLVGITIYGHECSPHYPEVFIFIPSFREWIKTISGI